MCSTTVRVNARNPVCASCRRCPAIRDAKVAESQLVKRRDSGSPPSRRRAPATRSACPSARGASRRGISSGGCCPSPSRVTIISAPSAQASAMPVRRATPFPRLRGCVRTDAPFPLPSSPVPSVEPSSTTITWASGRVARVRVTTSPIVAVAWNAGITTATRNLTPFEDAEHRFELGAELLDGFGGQRAPRFGLELAGTTILFDLLARAFDRVFLGVQQVLDEHDQVDLAPLVDAIARAVLGGIQEPELALPIAQHVRLQVGELADLADREELLNRLGRRVAGAHRLSAFSSRSIRSLTAWRGGLFSNSTFATSRAIGSSTPWRSPRATAVRAVLTPSTTACVRASAAATDCPCPSATPRPRLRDSAPVAVRIKSPRPARPANVIGCAPSATPSRVISARPRVISAARVLKPSPSPSRIPAASAMTFFSAPPSSTPITSVCEYTRKYGVANRRCARSATV